MNIFPINISCIFVNPKIHVWCEFFQNEINGFENNVCFEKASFFYKKARLWVMGLIAKLRGLLGLFFTRKFYQNCWKCFL